MNSKLKDQIQVLKDTLDVLTKLKLQSSSLQYSLLNKEIEKLESNIEYFEDKEKERVRINREIKIRRLFDNSK